MKRAPVAAGVSLGLLLFAFAAQAAENAPYTPVAPQRQAQAMFRLLQPAQAVHACQPGERSCAIGQYIGWCCRADQQCDYRYAGGCR